jgi:hypothetical protein
MSDHTFKIGESRELQAPCEITRSRCCHQRREFHLKPAV